MDCLTKTNENTVLPMFLVTRWLTDGLSISICASAAYVHMYVGTYVWVCKSCFCNVYLFNLQTLKNKMRWKIFLLLSFTFWGRKKNIPSSFFTLCQFQKKTLLIKIQRNPSPQKAFRSEESVSASVTRFDKILIFRR
jgi:hypothetical protein